jgi:hypothetical protein
VLVAATNLVRGRRPRYPGRSYAVTGASINRVAAAVPAEHKTAALDLSQVSSLPKTHLVKVNEMIV